MHRLDVLTSAQLRDAAEALGEWIAAQRHEAQAAAEVLDKDGAAACRDRADRVEAVRQALAAAADRADAGPGRAE